MRPAFRSSPLPSSHGLKSVPIAAQEKFLTALLALWLVFLPLAFGTMRPWAQFTSLGLSAVAFIVAVLPRRFDDDGSVHYPASLLWRQPVFWLAVALLLYVAIQGLNPTWIWKKSETHWWLEKTSAIAWLPSGVQAPFSEMNSWRVITIWGATLLAGCAAWIGITRRRTVSLLLHLFVINATCVGALGIAQRVSGTNKIYWVHHFKDAEIFGSFIYRNHGAAFLVLALILTLGLALHHYLKGESRGARSTPAPVIVFLAVPIAGSIVISTSRIGVVAGSVALVATAIFFAIKLWRQNLARPALPIIAVAVVTAFGGWALAQANLTGFLHRMESLFKQEGDASLTTRAMGADMARDMFQSRPLWGIGAGGYRHLESSFGSRHPALSREFTFHDGNHAGVGRFRMRDAHNDHLQFLAELGIVGAGLLYALLACGLACLTTRQRWHHPIVIATLVAVLTLFGIAVVDFPFLNPAILGSLAVIWTLAVRSADLERPTSALTES